jgi:hypothetical protein
MHPGVSPPAAKSLNEALTRNGPGRLHATDNTVAPSIRLIGRNQHQRKSARRFRDGQRFLGVLQNEPGGSR